MALINANELKRKDNILLDGQPCTVLEVTTVSPSARGASSLVKAKVKNLLNGAVQDKTFKTAEKFQEPDIELTPVSYLYADPDGFHFMDEACYEQFSISREKMGEASGYLKEGTPSLQALKYNGAYVSIQFPVYVELKIVYAEPAVRGDTAGNVLKKATLETGIEVQVPMYVKDGETVRVNTQTGEVSGRA